jgi:hypothetical protein
MNNQYIFSPKIDLNLGLIKSIVYRHLNKFIPGMATHHRLVKDEPYLVSLKKRYPFFSDIYNIYPTPQGYITPIHICPDRACALNIPIQYTEDSHTIFYELDDSASLVRNDERIYDIVESGATEVFRYTLTEPVIMNTLLPHGVIGGPEKTRIIMSWSISFDTSYDELRQLYGQ